MPEGFKNRRIDMNALDIILIAAVAGVAALAVAKLVRNKKQGRGTCGCGCANCPTKCGKGKTE